MIMVGQSVSASLSPSADQKVNAKAYGKTAVIYSFPRVPFPKVEDFARECAALIWATLRAPSQRAVCQRAAQETGAASPDTFDRILSGETKRPDFYLMRCVMAIAASRGVAIPPALVIRGI